ncbi:MAG: hypothetical protein H7331_03475 [Bacteroidia bacterium]|nr:hypothetical protein [Bacteroidia bacterium]
MKFITTLLLTTLFYTTCAAQGTLLFVDGRKAECAVVDYTTDSVKVKYTLINKTKIRSTPKDQLFSYTPKLTNEIVFYTNDSLGENELSEREMRMYMLGQQDARVHYKTPISILGGALFGLASGYFLPPLLSPLGVVPFVVVNGLIIRRVNRKKVYNKLYLAEETYLMGYEKIAKGKRVQQSLISGIAGVVVGIAAASIVNSVVNK